MFPIILNIETSTEVCSVSMAKDGQTLFGFQAWSTHYATWTAAAGLGSKIGAFATGAANMISTIGIPHQIGIVIMGVFVASFAGTTLDTATRVQRYIVTEMFPKTFKNRCFSTAVVILFAIALIFSTGASGKGAQQLLALMHGAPGVGQFTAQIRQRAIGAAQDLVMGIVLGRARRTFARPVS